MKYLKPVLHTIDGVNSNAVCAGGSSPAFGDICTTGTDISSSMCSPLGNAAENNCFDGTAAINSECLAGNFFGDLCAAGGTP